MIIPRKVTSQGRLKSAAKKVLIVAVAGYLSFGGGPTPPPLPPNFLTDGYKKELQSATLQERLKQDDEEIIMIIKVFLQCQG